MWGNITELESRAELGSDVWATHELVKTWGRLNLWRGLYLAELCCARHVG